MLQHSEGTGTLGAAPLTIFAFHLVHSSAILSDRTLRRVSAA
jgi:hypothetical protein